MGKVFLSYSRTDSLEFARELHRRFVRDGIMCFFDEASIEWGENFVLALENGLDKCDHIIVVLSPGFVSSEWTTVERTSTTLDDPSNLKRKLLPLLHRPCERPRFLKPVQYLDVTTDELFENHYPTICEQLGGTLQPDVPEVDYDSPLLPPAAQLPVRHRMPYPSLGSRFSGRVQPLLDLHKLLLKSDGIVVVEGIGVVVGTGGLGKTQLAIEYVHRLGAHYIGGVFWVSADQPYVNVIQELAQYADIELDDRLSVNQQAERLWQGLSQYSGSILIIYDNFPDDIPFQPWLPVNATKIKTLVTTRRQDLAQPKIILPYMDNTESLMVLNSRVRQFDKQEAQPLIEALGGLPLALELTCNFLNHHTLSVEQLVQKMSSLGDMSVLDKFATKYADDLPSGHEKAVSATFQISWQQASISAQNVLGVMAWWAPVPVPRRLLRRALNSEDDSEGALLDPVDEAIEELVQLSLVEIDKDHDPYLHRLLRGFIRVSSEQDGNRNTAVSTVTTEMGRAYDVHDAAAYVELEKVLPHAISVLDEMPGEVDQLSRLANNCGRHHQDRGRFSLAEPLFRKGLEIYQQVLGEAHPNTAASYNNVASNLDDQGRYEEAEPLFRKGLEICQQVLGEAHPSTATSYNNVAYNLNAQGRYEEAEPLFRKGLEIRQQVLGEAHPSTATSYNNVASNLDDQGRYEEAEPLYRKGLEIRQQVLGEAHPDTAASYNNVASNLNAQGRYEEAEPLFRKGLEIRQQVLGEAHPDTAGSYNNVAYNLNAQGRYEEAEPLFRKGLEIRQQVLDEAHPDTAASYNNVAYNLDDQGRYEEAEPLFRKGLEIRQQVLGEAHPSTATSYNNVASNLDDQGRYEEAEPLYRKGLEIRQQVLGEAHPDTAASYNNVAYNLNAQGRYEEAEPLFRKGLEVCQQVLGSDHPTTRIMQGNLDAFLNKR